jgi:polysaccharide export outer membrane protein
MQVKFNQNWIITMSNHSTGELANKQFGRESRLHNGFGPMSASGLLLVGVLLLALGCEGPPPKKGGNRAPAASAAIDKSIPAEVASMAHQAPITNSDSIVLSPGDTVRITFPGAENLNRVALIRRDGYVTLPLIGEFKAAGLRPREMEKQLLELYGPQLQTKEVSVAVESSAFPVYVTGAVLRPGKILSDRPLTALEAVMEAGGFDYSKANLKAIRVLRTREGRTEQYTLNLKRVLQGQESQQFQLKPGDIVYVPEKFNFF